MRFPNIGACPFFNHPKEANPMNDLILSAAEIRAEFARRKISKAQLT
ncbi:MAG TPA: hypothetical protein PLL58_01950 [Candidatus Syntrophosphaera sp.]|jgi:hypothetical protein|nr:hypothetical protein [Candidatus Cloacimonadota bacterium]HQP26565.1 hypothetical protein [Candidatus Syntrophosphaera sp.]